MKHYGIDWAKEGADKTVIVIWYGGRAHGKTFFSKLWLRHYHDLLSRHLVRRLAAEAVINISINS